ncbi:MAG: M6 family metalloprotease domain-containing protein [Desulfobacterales bacterium]
MSAIFGEIRHFPQEKGPDIRLRVFGDEFYARYESETGYTAVYDPEVGTYCYAELVNGHLISGGVPLSRCPPREIRRHIQENKEIRNAIFRMRHRDIYPPLLPSPGIAGARCTDGGLLPGRRITKGKIRGLTVIVNFRDVKTHISVANVSELFNAETCRINRNHCSVRDYFLTVSGGKLDYSSFVVGPVTLSRKRGYYISHSLAEEALAMAISEFLVDLSEFDSSHEKVIDAVTFLYAGRSLYKNRLWPQNRSFSPPVIHNGYTFGRYMLAGLGRYPVDMSIGTICHETGHMLCGFPDMYDYGISTGDADISPGLGSYCLMALGQRLNYGRTPAPVCAYLRDLAGWCDRETLLNHPDLYEIPYGDYHSVFRYETHRPNEYFLLENRTRMKMDAYLPASGLAVYHCDTMGRNGWNGGTPDLHPRCVLLQADGSLHLETGRNTGGRFDLFGKTDGVAVSADTLPSSKAWDGTETGLNLVDISEAGEVIRFKTGTVSDRGETHIANTPLIVREVFPDMVIPDDNSQGLSSVIHIARHGNIEDILLTVDIHHAFIGDLEVFLKTPSGSKIMLHNRDWSEQTDLQLTYDAEGMLAGLKGKPVHGDWILCIRDMALNDIGKLNFWSLLIEYTPTDRIIQIETVSGLKIPPADWNGISSAIPIDQEGVFEDIRVYAEVTHPCIGDLQISLTAPSGRSVVLKPFGEGKLKANIRQIYDTGNHDGLAAMVRAGQEMQGEWLLEVTDCKSEGPGILVKWSLALICPPVPETGQG